MKDYELGHIVIPLLKGVVYADNDNKLWQYLIHSQASARDYLKQVSLELIIDDNEGYAYCQQIIVSQEDAPENPLPKLLHRKPLSYPLSILCLLLRKRILEQDNEGGAVRTVMTESQIIESAIVYLKNKQNEAKNIDLIRTQINKLIELGLLRPLKDAQKTYEVRRIIKAMIDAEWLQKIDNKLAEYLEHDK